LYADSHRFVPEWETKTGLAQRSCSFGKSKVQIHARKIVFSLSIRGICCIAQVLGCVKQLLEAASDDSEKLKTPVGYSLLILLRYININLLF
jgi:hypothetical protein